MIPLPDLSRIPDMRDVPLDAILCYAVVPEPAPARPVVDVTIGARFSSAV
jgi:hypothetical protein